MNHTNLYATSLSNQELTTITGGVAPVVVAFGVVAFKGFSVTGGAIIMGSGLYKAGQSFRQETSLTYEIDV